jgi:hypothetical protein
MILARFPVYDVGGNSAIADALTTPIAVMISRLTHMTSALRYNYPILVLLLATIVLLQ